MYSNDCNGLIQAIISGKGIASHVGNFSVGLSYCFAEDPFVSEGDVLETITAANGDQIHTKLIDYEMHLIQALHTRSISSPVVPGGFLRHPDK